MIIFYIFSFNSHSSCKFVLVGFKHGHIFLDTLFERWGLYLLPLNPGRLVTALKNRVQPKWRNALKGHASSALASGTSALGVQNHHFGSTPRGHHALIKEAQGIWPGALGTSPHWASLRFIPTQILNKTSRWFLCLYPPSSIPAVAWLNS